MENRKIRMQTIWKYFENWKMENLGSTKMGKELEYSKIKKTQRLKNGPCRETKTVEMNFKVQNSRLRVSRASI